MLSETTVKYLSKLNYRIDAKQGVQLCPLVSICWEDEMPDRLWSAKIPEDDAEQIWRLYSIRVRLWKGEALPQNDQEFWDTARLQVPGWAFFHRGTVSEDDQCAQEEAERTAAELFEALIADADDVTISEEMVSRASPQLLISPNGLPTLKRRSDADAS
jgi:hypothetical protein